MDNCFANKEYSCAILTEKICKSGHCPFGATRDEVLRHREAAMQSLKKRGLRPIVKHIYDGGDGKGYDIQSVTKEGV